jgi:hypothetical protein
MTPELVIRAPAAATLMVVWERGRGLSQAQQALVLLGAAAPETPPATLRALSVGTRDAALLRLRELLFGRALACVTACPRCAERLELNLSVDDLDLPSAAGGVVDVQAETYQARFRQPSAGDLAELAPSATPDMLLMRCLVALYQGDRPVQPTVLPPALVRAAAAALADADPLADVQLALSCPACDDAWQATFDIVSYLWAELEAWAQRTLVEVHTLASAYGWREDEILALSPWRRRRYIEMVTG